MVGLGRAGSTLEMDSVYENKKIGSHSKSLRRFFGMLCVVDDPHIYMQKELLATIFIYACMYFLKKFCFEI